MRKAGAKGIASHGCGVHIHIGFKSEAGDHNARSLTNLANIMAAHKEQIGRAIKIDERRVSSYCMTVDPVFLRKFKEEKLQTMEALVDMWYRSPGMDYGRDNHYHNNRYHMLNLHVSFTKGTMSKLAKGLTYARPIPQTELEGINEGLPSRQQAGCRAESIRRLEEYGVYP